MNSSKNVPLIKFLFRSRSRNIQRAWRLRKLNIQRRDDLCAMVRTMAAINHQRDEAIQECAGITRQRDEAILIADEALGGGHRSYCGWQDDNDQLEKLKQEIE